MRWPAGSLGDKQDFVIQFSQESAVLQGIRPEMSREGIFTIPSDSEFGPDYSYLITRIR